jgi:indole-3-glycerol phosphate synthase/phosphoribosylanthranilate isomerase
VSTVLAGLVHETRAMLYERRHREPLAQLERRVEPATRSFRAALERPGPRFILELKRASPSEGPLRAQYDPRSIAEAYRGVADAVSVITASPRFGGSLADLRAVSTDAAQPLLCKDFILDPYQVTEARLHGADAVLLMLSVLDDAGWRQCAAVAASLGMDVLTEVHDEAEVARAIGLDARIIGINNRDLRTLAVDLATTERLAPLVPRDRLIVAESGIRTRKDVVRLAGHAQAFLVGTALMRAASPGIAARELVHGRVKICGLTSPADARLAWRAGASLGGVILAESPRRVDEKRAREIADASPLPLVGVFVDMAPASIGEFATRLGFAAVQLHGTETPAAVRAVRRAVPASCEIWKAVRVDGVADVPDLARTGADRVLLDCRRPGFLGGSGMRFSWEGLDRHPDRDRLVLAGGINPVNAGAASRSGCGIVDLASGVESSPGVKDPALLDQLFTAIREAAC